MPAQSDSIPPKPKPKPKPSASQAAVTGAHSTWQSDDSGRVDRGVVRAFTTDLKKAGQSAGFPALLVGVMVAFLLVQHRLDRRDVKLSQADWVSDQGLEFSAPTTRR